MKQECLICKAPLVYLETETFMECKLCHKQEMSKTQCTNGHYICNECHTKGLNSVIAYCMQETSTDPVYILEKMFNMPFCHMHGPEHHTLVGSALLTAYHNTGGHINLETALNEMIARSTKVPGGTCGFWGCCGAAVSTGIFMSIITGATPLTTDSWAMSNLMTAQSLIRVANIGGPRCCKRNSYTSVQTAAEYVSKTTGVELKIQKTIVCSRHNQNNQCIGVNCPYHPSKHKKPDTTD